VTDSKVVVVVVSMFLACGVPESGEESENNMIAMNPNIHNE
jgi:hypothetical protein